MDNLEFWTPQPNNFITLQCPRSRRKAKDKLDSRSRLAPLGCSTQIQPMAISPHGNQKPGCSSWQSAPMAIRNPDAAHGNQESTMLFHRHNMERLGRCMPNPH
eukprot:1161308-Pelagomonas_calceolata.AAC.1